MCLFWFQKYGVSYSTVSKRILFEIWDLASITLKKKRTGTEMISLEKAKKKGGNRKKNSEKNFKILV